MTCLHHYHLRVFVLFQEIDAEGVIEPDNDPPQEMGDDALEVGTKLQ